MNETNLCSPPRKHVIRTGHSLCDCGMVKAGRTADGESKLVTILDPLQTQGLQTWAKA